MHPDLAIIGPYPPPHGGVSVHVERLLDYLDRAGVAYCVYNTAGPAEIPGRVVSVAARRHGWFLGHLLRGREPVVYVLSSKWPVQAATWIPSRLRGKRVVINLQGEALSDARVVRWLLRAAFRRATRLVAASPHLRDYLLGLGDFADKTEVIPGFIPPRCRPDDAAAIAEEVKQFCAAHDPVLLGTGAAVLRNGVDLYGIDLTIDLVERLRASHPRVGVLWSLLEIIGRSPAYTDRLRDRIREGGLSAHWHFAPPQPVFHPVYDRVDVLVRPTASDGDALSIREALSFGVPCVASDAAPRPAQVATFRSRDLADYERAVRGALAHLAPGRPRAAQPADDAGARREVALLRAEIDAARRAH